MRIVIIDDDKLVCQALKTIIETDQQFNVVATGYNGHEAVELYNLNNPDIILMDIRMDGLTGIDAGEIILKTNPHAKILYLTTFLDNEYIIRALKIGAKGYLLKQNFDCILPSLRAVELGQSVFGEEIVSKIPEMMNTSKKSFEGHALSEKEIEMIELIADGLSNKEIAAKKYLSEGTVRNYISSILEKLNLRDRTQIAIFYYKN
jgi:DNA-binding NarL/FixJ family response regulator